jgi:ribonuclease-3
MEEICDGRNNLRILGSMFEAWVGALYLQEADVGRGLQQCNDLLIKIIERHIDFVQIIIEDTNYKDQLLRKFQSLYHQPPKYAEIAVVGPSHDRIFTMGVIDPSNNVLTTATARNKKVAEQEASRLALELLDSDINTNVTKKVNQTISPKPSPILGPSTPPPSDLLTELYESKKFVHRPSLLSKK